MRLSDLWPPTRLSDLWSVLVLAATAAAFLLLGRSVTKEALAAAGFALTGAAITRLVDVMQERARNKAAAQERRRTDLEETRRLAYMALFAMRTEHPELHATIVNAFAHHGLEVPFQEAADHLAYILQGDLGGQSRRWLQEQIDRITVELDAEP